MMDILRELLLNSVKGFAQSKQLIRNSNCIIAFCAFTQIICCGDKSHF